MLCRTLPDGYFAEESIAVDDACSVIMKLAKMTPMDEGQAFHIWNGQRYRSLKIAY